MYIIFLLKYSFTYFWEAYYLDSLTSSAHLVLKIIVATAHFRDNITIAVKLSGLCLQLHRYNIFQCLES